MHRPGFDWEACIKIMPGLTARVHDACISGEGIVHATLLGLVSLVNLRGTLSNYEVRDGMRIPLEGEVAWMLPAGPKPYWRGRITKLSY